MKYWFNRDLEKNNIVILTDKALLISSVVHSSMRSVNRKLELEVHPRDIFGGENLQVIPLNFLKSIVSCSTNPVLEINFSSKGTQKSEKISFTDFESKRDFVALFDALLARANDHKLIKKEQRQPLHLRLILPILSLLLGLTGSYLYFNQFSLLTITLGGAWVVCSLYILIKHLIRPPKVVSWTNKGQAHPKVCRTNHAVIAYSFLALIGIIEVVSSFYIPDLNSPANLYKNMQKKGVSYTVREFLEGKSTRTSLISALRQKDDELAVALLKKGADPSITDVGETALDIAIKNSLNKAVKTMLDEKAPTGNSKNILIRAVKAGGLSHENLDRIILIAEDINYKDDQGLTALGNAIVHKTEVASIQCMLEMGASNDIKVNNLSPVEYAKKQGDNQLSNLLELY